MEPGIIVLMVIVSIIVGIAIGILVERSNRAKKRSGVIYVYLGNSEGKPPLFLESDVSIDNIAAHKQVMFDVVVTR